MKHSMVELYQRLADTKEICAILRKRLEDNPKDVSASLCLESENELIQDIMQELKIAESDMPYENIDNNQDELSHNRSYAYRE